MTEAPPPKRDPLMVRCTPCGHTWAAAYLPMDAGAFVRVLNAVRCPNCAATTRHITLAPQEAP